MTETLHKIIHLLAEIENEELIQSQSHERKKKLFDQIGEIINEVCKDERVNG